MPDREVIAVEVESSGQLSALVKAVETTGNVVRITRNGQPVAELTPVSTVSALPIYPELTGVIFNADPTAPLDNCDSRDVEVIRRSLQQYEAGDSKELHAFMDEVRGKLLAMKDAPANGASK